MSLDPNRIREISDRNETEADEQFRRLGYGPERLDRQGRRSRPEFLIYDGMRPILVCEVKTIVSGGYLRDRGAHVSTEDPAALNSGGLRTEIDFRNLEEKLADSVRKYRCLVDDRPDLRGVPLVVVLFSDFFADHFDLYPTRMEEFPEVSGLLRIERDAMLRDAARQLETKELKRRMEADDLEGLPLPSIDFRLLENECAQVAVPRSFAEKCLPSRHLQ